MVSLSFLLENVCRLAFFLNFYNFLAYMSILLICMLHIDAYTCMRSEEGVASPGVILEL